LGLKSRIKVKKIQAGFKNLSDYWRIPDSRFKISNSRTCPPTGGFKIPDQNSRFKIPDSRFQIQKLVRLLAELVRLLTDSPFDKLRAGSFDRFSANPKLFASSLIFSNLQRGLF